MPTIARVRSLRQEYELLGAAIKKLPAPTSPTSSPGGTGGAGGADALRRHTPSMADFIAELDKRYGRK